MIKVAGNRVSSSKNLLESDREVKPGPVQAVGVKWSEFSAVYSGRGLINATLLLLNVNR